jgi:hypothetical protein
VHSKEAAAFVDAVAKHKGQSDAQRWVQMLLDPKRSWSTVGAIRTSEVPLCGFDDQQAFEQWWRNHQEGTRLLMDELQDL